MEVVSKKNKVMQLLLIAVGGFIMAAGVNFIFEPMNMVTGGVSGFAIVLKSWTEPFIQGGIPLWFTNILCNVPLFIIAIILKGKRYLARTIFANVCFTIGLYIIPSYPILQDDYVLAAVFGGVIMGTGLGLVFLNGASTGGTDLLGVILQTKIKHYSVPQLLLILDATIVTLGAVAFGVSRACYAIITVYVTTVVMDTILEGMKFGRIAYIISDRHNDIAEEILNGVNRGVTGIQVEGMYSNNERKMLFCVVSKKEIVKLKSLVSQIDEKAFVIVCDAREVLGEGFIEYRQE